MLRCAPSSNRTEPEREGWPGDKLGAANLPFVSRYLGVTTLRPQSIPKLVATGVMTAGFSWEHRSLAGEDIQLQPTLTSSLLTRYATSSVAMDASTGGIDRRATYAACCHSVGQSTSIIACNRTTR